MRPKRRLPGAMAWSRRVGLVALICALPGWPGGTLAAQLSVSVVGGVSFSSFTGSGAVDVVSGVSPLVGVASTVSLSETLALRQELYLVRKGAQVNTRLGDFDAGPNKEFSLPYLKVPFLVELRTAPGGLVRPRLFGGISTGFLVNCTLEGQECDQLQEINYRQVDLGVVVGGELEWQRWALGTRYEAGVRAFEVSTPGGELYNGALSITLRFQLRRTPQ